MSYFIGNTISFSKDRKTFRVKGGDNNLYPRSNEWTSDMDISYLFYEISTGNIRLTTGIQKNLIVSNTSYNYKEIFGGTWDAKDTYYFIHNKKEKTEKEKEIIENINKSFLSELFYKIDNIDKNDYILTNGYKYIYSFSNRSYRTTPRISDAKIYKKEIAEKYAQKIAGYYLLSQ